VTCGTDTGVTLKPGIAAGTTRHPGPDCRVSWIHGTTAGVMEQLHTVGQRFARRAFATKQPSGGPGPTGLAAQ
jgi:hypothetical protein